MAMAIGPYYRRFELPWELDAEQESFFRRLWIALLVACLLLGALIAVIRLPERDAAAESSVPPRLAKVLIERELPPPPPPPPPPPEEPRPTPETRPRPTPEPVDRTTQARQTAQRSISRLADELADLRRDFVDPSPTNTRNLSAAVGEESKAERSMITSKAGAASSGVQSTGSSRGFGSGAGSHSGHSTTSVASRVAGIGGAGQATRSGVSGKASRSPEEIELVFDRNKGAIYSLYSRALRERPELQGKLVLEFTIAPSGEITACRVVSSELNDPELERRIVARVRLIRFEAKDVETLTTTKPIEFFPA